MYKKFVLKLVFPIVLLVAFFETSANDVTPGKILSSLIKEAHAEGTTFKEVNLFAITYGEKHTNTLRQETLLSPNTNNIQQLYSQHPKAISINLIAENGKQYTLELIPSTPLAYDPDLGYIDLQGRHRIHSFEAGVHYQGAVVGLEQSFATLSVFSNGEVMILFGTDEGNFVVGKLDDNSGKYVFYNDKDFVNPLPNKCGVSDSDYPDTHNQNSQNKTTAPYQCNKVSIYWEADFQTYEAKLSNVTLTRNYLIGLFNQVQALYRNQKVAVELKSIYIWTVADNYDSTTSHAGLNSFKDRWNAVGDTFNGNLAMLLARDQKGNGGVAFVGVLCAKGTAYAYGDINATYSTIPTYSWDVEMVTHEHGHNMGSKHTHWCGWMTGPGGTCGAVDNCTTLEASGSCSTCPYQYDNSQDPTLWKGTIMSYCHLTSRGINLANGFGPLPGNKIRTEVSSSSCLSSIISVTLTPKPACTIDGEVKLTFDADTIGSSNFSTAPYRFTWSNGPTTQSISALKDPGVYTVAIEDSNGCKKSFSATVTKDTGPNCWKTGITSLPNSDNYVSVYPNPASKEVSVRYYSNNSSTGILTIKDLTGRTVYSNNITPFPGENNSIINISNLSKGMYFMGIETSNMVYSTIKLFVE